MTYRELQTALKTIRNNGTQINCKLNAKKEVLQSEYNRVVAGQTTMRTILAYWEDENLILSDHDTKGNSIPKEINLVWTEDNLHQLIKQASSLSYQIFEVWDDDGTGIVLY